MPKALRNTPPSSAVVTRLFEMEAAARAIAVRAPEPPPIATPEPLGQTAPDPTKGLSNRGIIVPPVAQTTGEQPNLKRQLVLTPSTEKTFVRLVEIYQRSTNTKLTSSHVMRAILIAIEHCMDQLDREATRIGPLKLPRNARGKEFDRERFEARLADAFVAGMRAAAAFHRDET